MIKCANDFTFDLCVHSTEGDNAPISRGLEQISETNINKKWLLPNLISKSSNTINLYVASENLSYHKCNTLWTATDNQIEWRMKSCDYTFGIPIEKNFKVGIGGTINSAVIIYEFTVSDPKAGCLLQNTLKYIIFFLCFFLFL